MRTAALVAATVWLLVAGAAVISGPFRESSTAVNEAPHQDALYQAIADTIYHPQRYASVRDPGGLVLLQSQSISGFEYLGDRATLARLRDTVRPASADSILRSYRAANAESTSFEYVLNRVRANVVLLDSATARVILDENDAAARADPILMNIILGMPPDSLPGVLSLSRPGISPDGNTAMMFASLRERRSLEPDHLEAAAFLIARRDGFRWRVIDEVPVARERRR
jgi:hypothetical protein